MSLFNADTAPSLGDSDTTLLQKICKLLSGAVLGTTPLATAPPASGFALPPYDYQQVSYIGSTNNIDTIAYKRGGSGGTVVATLTFTYVAAGAADDDKITSITRT